MLCRKQLFCKETFAMRHLPWAAPAGQTWEWSPWSEGRPDFRRLPAAGSFRAGSRARLHESRYHEPCRCRDLRLRLRLISVRSQGQTSTCCGKGPLSGNPLPSERSLTNPKDLNAVVPSMGEVSTLQVAVNVSDRSWIAGIGNPEKPGGRRRPDHSIMNRALFHGREDLHRHVENARLPGVACHCCHSGFAAFRCRHPRPNSSGFAERNDDVYRTAVAGQHLEPLVRTVADSSCQSSTRVMR